jgi:hypothetical protein
MMMNYEDFLFTVTLSDETYAGLLIKVEEFYRNQPPVNDLQVLTSDFVSDRYSKKVYYFAVLKRGSENNKVSVPPFVNDEDSK